MNSLDSTNNFGVRRLDALSSRLSGARQCPERSDGIKRFHTGDMIRSLSDTKLKRRQAGAVVFLISLPSKETVSPGFISWKPILNLFTSAAKLSAFGSRPSNVAKCIGTTVLARKDCVARADIFAPI